MKYQKVFNDIITNLNDKTGCEDLTNQGDRCNTNTNMFKTKSEKTFDESFQKKYDENISKRIKLAKERFDLLKKQKGINNAKLENELSTNKTKSQKYKNKLKSDHYNYSKHKDNKKHYIIITVLHIIILMFIFLGIFSIISPPITTLVLVIFYIIIFSIVYFKLKKDEIRSPVTYTSYNPKESKEEVCKL